MNTNLQFAKKCLQTKITYFTLISLSCRSLYKLLSNYIFANCMLVFIYLKFCDSNV
jgi:hypothetical protein